MKRYIKRQLVGMVIITILVALYAIVMVVIEHLSPEYAAGHVTISYDGEGRRGLFVQWVLAIVVFSFIHVVISVFRSFRRAKR